ncbi:hypothetical protein AURDEDRAFT_172263 [Auricularia subglabra TFB-10046 SS5]|nr:hypothetical protein AURDEDRAFT_172263 [Auricularia subglabra TFB-10046 SS5]
MAARNTRSKPLTDSDMLEIVSDRGQNVTKRQGRAPSEPAAAAGGIQAVHGGMNPSVGGQTGTGGVPGSQTTPTLAEADAASSKPKKGRGRGATASKGNGTQPKRGTGPMSKKRSEAEMKTAASAAAAASSISDPDIVPAPPQLPGPALVPEALQPVAPTPAAQSAPAPPALQAPAAWSVPGLKTEQAVAPPTFQAAAFTPVPGPDAQQPVAPPVKTPAPGPESQQPVAPPVKTPAPSVEANQPVALTPPLQVPAPAPAPESTPVPGPEAHQERAKTPLFLLDPPSPPGESVVDAKPQIDTDGTAVDPEAGAGTENSGSITLGLGQLGDDALLEKVIEAVSENEYAQDEDGAPLQDEKGNPVKPGPFSQAELDRIHGIANEFYRQVQEVACETNRAVSAILNEAKVAMKLSKKPTLYNLHTKRFCARMREDVTAGKLALPELRARWNDAYNEDVRTLSKDEKKRLYDELLEWEAGKEKKHAHRVKQDGNLYKVMLRIRLDFDDLATYYYNLYDIVIVGFVVSSNPGDADATRANGVFAPNKGILSMFKNSDLRTTMGELGALATTQRAAAVPIVNYSNEEEEKVVSAPQQTIKDHTSRVIRQLQARVRKETKLRDRVTWTNFPIELVVNEVCVTGWPRKMALFDKPKTILNNTAQCQQLLRADFATHRGELTGDAMLGIWPLTEEQLALKKNPKTISEWFRVPIWIEANGEARLTVGEALAESRARAGDVDDDDDVPGGEDSGKARKRARSKKKGELAEPAASKEKIKPGKAPRASRKTAPSLKRRKVTASAPAPAAKKLARKIPYVEIDEDDEELPAASSSSSASSGDEDSNPEVEDATDGAEDTSSRPIAEKPHRANKQVGGAGIISTAQPVQGASGVENTTPLPYQGSLQHGIVQRTALTVGDVPLDQEPQNVGGSSEPADMLPSGSGAGSLGGFDMPMPDWMPVDNVQPPAAVFNNAVGSFDAFSNMQLSGQGQAPLQVNPPALHTNANAQNGPTSSAAFGSMAGSLPGGAGGVAQLAGLAPLLSQMPPHLVAQLPPHFVTQVQNAALSQIRQTSGFPFFPQSAPMQAKAPRPTAVQRPWGALGALGARKPRGQRSKRARWW